MKQIQELIKATQVLRVEGNSDTRVSRLAYDSRRIAPGDCFFAVSGTQSDGHAYIDAAVAAGAVAVVCQRLAKVSMVGMGMESNALYLDSRCNWSSCNES